MAPAESKGGAGRGIQVSKSEWWRRVQWKLRGEVKGFLGSIKSPSGVGNQNLRWLTGVLL